MGVLSNNLIGRELLEDEATWVGNSPRRYQVRLFDIVVSGIRYDSTIRRKNRAGGFEGDRFDIVEVVSANSGTDLSVGWFCAEDDAILAKKNIGINEI